MTLIEGYNHVTCTSAMGTSQRTSYAVEVIGPRLGHNNGHGALGVHLGVHAVDDFPQVQVGRLGFVEEPRLCGDGHDGELRCVAKYKPVEVGSRGVQRTNVV